LVGHTFSGRIETTAGDGLKSPLGGLLAFEITDLLGFGFGFTELDAIDYPIGPSVGIFSGQLQSIDATFFSGISPLSPVMSIKLVPFGVLQNTVGFDDGEALMGLGSVTRTYTIAHVPEPSMGLLEGTLVLLSLIGIVGARRLRASPQMR
jgi:hypothetical protein